MTLMTVMNTNFNGVDFKMLFVRMRLLLNCMTRNVQRIMSIALLFVKLVTILNIQVQFIEALQCTLLQFNCKCYFAIEAKVLCSCTRLFSNRPNYPHQYLFSGLTANYTQFIVRKKRNYM